MTGETNLSKLIRDMEPVLNAGEYVFTTVANVENIDREDVLCEFKEAEGVTVVIKRETADAHGLTYAYIASWITLKVHSALEAVGLTAAFSNALAAHNISCNVIAGYYHDHIFVDKKDAQKALSALKTLSQQQ